MLKCTTCRRVIDERREHRWDMQGCGTFCSLPCIWKYRGQRKLV